MRRALSIAVALLGLASTGLAAAGPVTTYHPTASKLVAGSSASTNPLAELSAEDATYYEIASGPKDLINRTVYELRFKLPRSARAFGLHFNGHTTGSPCQLEPSAYVWKRRRFKSIGLPTTIQLGALDTDFSLAVNDGARRYLDRGRLRIRLACTNGPAFTLRSDTVDVFS